MSLHGCPINLSCKGCDKMEMWAEGEKEQYQKPLWKNIVQVVGKNERQT